MGLAFMTAKWIEKTIMIPKHLLKLTVSMICELSHAFCDGLLPLQRHNYGL